MLIILKKPLYYWLVLVFSFLLFGETKAQEACNIGYERIYATSQQANSNVTGTFLGLGDNNDVTNPNGSIGSDLTNYSSIGIPLILGTRYQRLKFPQAITSSAPIHVKLASTINLSVLSVTVEVQAYSSGTPVGTKVTLSSGILANLLAGENISDIVINSPSASYDAVQITLKGGLLSVGKLNVYAAYANQVATSAVTCNTVEDILVGSTSGLLGALNGVDDDNKATDNELSSYAIIRNNVNAAGYVHLTTLYSSPSVPGDQISVSLSIPNSSLLDADVFTKLSIVAYLGNNAVATLPINSPLLSLRLLDPSSQMYEFSFTVNSAFDRISVQHGGLASLLNSVYIHEIKKVIPKPPVLIDAAVLASKTICYAATAELSIPVINVQSCTEYNWYDAATAGNLVHTGTSYLLNGLSAGTHNYYVEAVREGCIDTKSERTPVTIIVKPIAQASDINAPSATICLGQSTILTATCNNAIILSPTFKWYDAELNGTLLLTGSQLSVTPIITTSYWVTIEGTGTCQNAPSSTKQVTVTVTSHSPPAFTVN